MQLDHRGDYFQHEHARFIQLEIKGTDENLIQLWELYDKLRVGTVILVETTLVCYHIPERDGVNGGDRKLVYTSLMLLNETIYQVYYIQGHCL